MRYMVKKSVRKSLVIKITPEGRIVVLAPVKCTDRFIDDFVNKKREWIEGKLQDIQDTKVSRAEYYNLEKFIIFGDYHDVLDMGEYYDVGGYHINKIKNKPIKDCFLSYAWQKAEEYLPERLAYISKTLGLEYSNLKIISARKKWGSCNNKKEIRLNFRLIMLPRYLIDYVICHELCHTQILNHSKDFWNMIKKIGFNKREVKDKFRPYGFILQML